MWNYDVVHGQILNERVRKDATEKDGLELKVQAHSSGHSFFMKSTFHSSSFHHLTVHSAIILCPYMYTLITSTANRMPEYVRHRRHLYGVTHPSVNAGA